MRVPNNPQKRETHKRLNRVFLDILFIFSHPKKRNGESKIAQKICSIITILSVGNSYKFGRMIVPSKLHRVAAKIIAEKPRIKFLRYTKYFIIHQ
jgi:hypothetical protein